VTAANCNKNAVRPFRRLAPKFELFASLTGNNLKVIGRDALQWITEATVYSAQARFRWRSPHRKVALPS